jgi:NADH-quinone oxidoreductase subunit L
LGWVLYARAPRATATSVDPLARSFPRAFAFLGARLKFDELYAATVFKLNSGLATLATFFDLWVWGGAVTLLARLGEFGGTANRDFDEEGLNAGFDTVSESVRGTGRRYSRAQTGEAHGYLRAIAIAFAIMALLLVWLGTTWGSGQ